MTIRIDGTNTTANPGITGGDADTGLQFGTDEVKIVTGGNDRVTVDSVGRFEVNSGSSGVISAKQNTNNGGFNIYEGKDSAGSTKFYVTHNGRVGAADGIIFGTDTAGANILNDYEEGTWTPVLSGGATASAGTMSGNYVKVGNIVHAAFSLLNSTITGAHTGLIQGLPYASFGQRAGGFGVNSFNAMSSANQTCGLITANSSEVILLRNSASAPWIQVGITPGSNRYFNFVCTYRVA